VVLAAHHLSIFSLYFRFLDSKKDFAVVTPSKTADGSDTLYSSVFDAHYHSSHGAMKESNHVFIKHGLEHYINIHNPDRLSILEIGMGTGLNVLLTLLHPDLPEIQYTAIEGYPIAPEIIVDLNYTSTEEESTLFQQIHSSPWEEWNSLKPKFQLYKNHELFENAEYQNGFDVVYFDAFAPSTQPHLWTAEVLSPIIDVMLPNAVLVTFCAQGAFKRSLKALGLEVERVPGPPGKREMTRGVKK